MPRDSHRENRLHEAIADHRDSGCRGLACECLVEKGSGCAAQLRLGQRQQADDPHAARERVRDAREVIQSAEPVSRNRPGRGSASTVVLIARTSSGARWISSMTALSRPRTKPTGSADAASRTVASSSVTNGTSSPAIHCASVVLPDCRGPDSSTTLVSARASRTRFSTWRGYMLPSHATDWLKDELRPIESQWPTI